MIPRNRNPFVAIGLAAAVALLWHGPAFAQEDNQRCEGTVTDDQGNPLAGVTITFLDLERNKEAQPVKTSKKGKYAHNVLRSSTSGGWEIKASLDGYKMVRITALSAASDGQTMTNESYMVGGDQKGIHKVAVPAQGRSNVVVKGKCIVDFVMAPVDTFNEVYHRLQAEKLQKEGKAPAEAAAGGEPGAAPGDVPPGSTASPAAPARSALDRARPFISNRDWAGSLEHLRAAVLEEPDSAEAHRWLGGALLQTGDLAGAEPELKKALELDPTYVGANFDMGSCYIKKGRLMQAIPHFEKELELIPDSHSIMQNLSKLYEDTEQFDKALAIYEKMIEAEPENVEAYGALAALYKAQGNTAKEEDAYRRMGEADPSGMAFYNLGTILFNKDEKQKAAEAYLKAIEVNPEHAEAHFQLGMTYVGLARFKDAVAELETFIKLKPKDPKAAEAKGMVADLRKMGG